MKLKLIFVLFNVLIIGSFIILFFMPAFLVGWDFAGTMWIDSWYLPLLFLLFISILNFYFVFNWRLFSLLEQEKWPELLDFLDDEFYIRSGGRRGLRLNKGRIRIYINGCIVTSGMEKISILSEFLKNKHPGLFAEFLLNLGLPQLLKEEPAALEDFYSQAKSLPKVKKRAWCLWIYAFALLLQKKEAAAEILEGLLLEKEPMIRLLSLYLLSIARKERFESNDERFASEKSVMKGLITADKLSRIREKEQGNILFFAMSKIIDQAFEWLHAPDTVVDTQ